MNIQTHNKIDQSLCGKPLELKEGYAKIEMNTLENMAVDEKGLVHGGYIFGLADHAAMIAVNHPNVVLGSAESKFLKPVKINEKVIAEAQVKNVEKQKHIVETLVHRNGDLVFKGTFVCFVLAKHVLD